MDCHVRAFEGGFVTCGAVMEGVNVTVAEGSVCTDQVVTHLAFAALPDERTCLCLQFVVAADDRVVYLSELRDLHLSIPNDLLNGYRRTLRSAAGETVLCSPPPCDEVMECEGPWLNVDDCLGVVVLNGGDRLRVDRSAKRRAGRYESLFTEEICVHVQREVVRCGAGEVLSDIGFAVLSGTTAEDTARVQGGALSSRQERLRGLWVDGANGVRYALVANFSDRVLRTDVLGQSVELAALRATVLTAH